MVDGATKALELTSVWDILEDVIKDNLTDPSVPKREKSGDWIRNGAPNPGDYLKKNGWIYPQVEIELPKPSTELKSLDGSKWKIMHSIPITCKALTRKQAMELSQQIKVIFEDTAADDLNTGCLHLIGINGSSDDSDFVGSGNDTKFYMYTIDYQFQRFD